ncbi:MetQ/NlpA family ABC transporter substrate-binding protein [Conexibacter sp. JD483]|uniref:MetQ/NlpA family ABC transporter substrate-binding protein n=1 Tax=unclassified Conexibacter TaxID=2627773 RepID=UPI002721AB52|nr:MULTISPECIES: MetQ/NlpA family ABC transporter substrate-binding protein [unclassified Conexibacter]MDO8189358.1 MetQ/NlpA family ABC transporter substrate-binding protein [Conexibacter sp. CPCC 205706]MDO8197365.1 MetQ/NlpA family ABC transporter substrate-binding protein [Conexibacter sp. CPCC 205762]MDR9372537.1 MetQ/NlpA family ABC transporter substrate-binding protein [Conexibacter sp. JD483]
MRRIALLPFLLLALALGLAACGSDDDSATTSSAAAASTTAADGARLSSDPLRVAATPVPHAEILQFVKDNLAQRAGLNLEIREFTDYVVPNTALDEGQVDANYFQTPGYLEDQSRARGFDFVSVADVHIEPLGLYSKQLRSVDAIPDGAKIAIPNDAANEARALRLLDANGIIGLEDPESQTATPRDIADNPHDLDFTEVEAAQTPRALDDVDLAVINGNYALEADLSPADDALVLERAEGNPNVNLLVTTPDLQNDPRIVELARLLRSDEVRRFIEQKYRGAVIPAA